MSAENVKPPRSYDTRRRRAAAERRRAAIVDAAERLFLEEGYAGTTVARIAGSAGVSVDTIYKSFGGKPGLIRAIRARALEGGGDVPAEQRSDALHEGDADPREIIRAWGTFTVEILPRVSPILLLIRDVAASDPEVGALLRELDDDRLRRMTENAQRLADAGHLRAGLTVAGAADVLWTYTSAELYELLVLRRGWTTEQYAAHAVDAMIAALLDP